MRKKMHIKRGERYSKMHRNKMLQRQMAWKVKITRDREIKNNFDRNKKLF